ncbi:MAG TPA: PD-(D/E)XK nuclease family protein [Acidimicrobiia bacterium]|jgi:putative RecB family exonuclease|nr:PD-(D/E)XK nuclease family protein [Acidimicrobiia bacterium]HEV3451644.1 PD-(D/E)XK nuclease family protein [Acidimicrobiia bacterium]
MAPLPYALSPSSISAFKECPLAYRFAYIDRLPEPPSVWTAKGTLVHLALQFLLDRPRDDRTLDAALADLDRARVTLAHDAEFAALELDDDERAAFDRDAEELVRRYFQLEDPQSVHPIGLELRLEAQVAGVRIRGVIDRLDLVDGELVVTDYKTGSVPSELFESKSLAGVHMYALLCEQNFGQRPHHVQLLYLSKPEAIIATPSDQSSTGLSRRTLALWAAIERACAHDDFRPHPSRLCDFCTFRPYCPAHGGDPVDAAVLRGPGTVIEPMLPLG